LTTAINRDVVGMLAEREIWQMFQDIVGVAPDGATRYGTFHSWLNRNYLATQGLAVRRQVDARNDVISLGRLLRDASNQGVITRERFLTRFYKEDDRGYGSRSFDSLAGANADSLSPTVPERHFSDLREKTANVRRWVSKEIAHFDKNRGEFSEGLTVADVHSAIDLVYATFNFYSQLLRDTTLVPTVTLHPWEAGFRVAWIPDDESLRRVRKQAADRDRLRLETMEQPDDL
jgi:hypothetical protein